jgi:hypothetical protein
MQGRGESLAAESAYAAERDYPPAAALVVLGEMRQQGDAALEAVLWVLTLEAVGLAGVPMVAQARSQASIFSSSKSMGSSARRWQAVGGSSAKGLLRNYLTTIEHSYNISESQGSAHLFGRLRTSNQKHPPCLHLCESGVLFFKPQVGILP